MLIWYPKFYDLKSKKIKKEKQEGRIIFEKDKKKDKFKFKESNTY